MARNLHCGATRPLCRERCVQSSLPCVGLVNRGADVQRPRPGPACYSLETLPAKEDKRRRDCCGNHLGCPRCGASGGLQCGLSGSRVSRRGNAAMQRLRGNHLIGDERCAVGKTNPYLSRKIYFRCRPVQFFHYGCRKSVGFGVFETRFIHLE